MEYFFSSKTYQNTNAEQICFFERDTFILSYKIENQIAKVPFQTSFAVIEGLLSKSFLKEFLSEVSLNSKKVNWTLPPLAYPKAEQHISFLMSNGFNISKIELNQHIVLDEKFEANLHSSKRNKLNQQKKGSFETRILPLSAFDQVYDLILENRELKNYPMTMSREKLKQLAHTFPDNFILFGTYFLDELAACSVTIKLSKTVIYQFYWAHKQSFADKNPLLFHNYQVACKAKEEGFKILDFGTSSVDGIINRGLFRYKKHLGAKQSKKYYLTYQF